MIYSKKHPARVAAEDLKFFLSKVEKCGPIFGDDEMTIEFWIRPVQALEYIELKVLVTGQSDPKNNGVYTMSQPDYDRE